MLEDDLPNRLPRDDEKSEPLLGAKRFDIHYLITTEAIPRSPGLG